MDTAKVSGPAGEYEVPVHRAALGTRVMQGVGLSIGLTAFRALSLGSIREVRGAALLDFAIALVVGGAVGGACYYATDSLRVRGGWRQTAANVGSILVYGFVIIALLLILLGPRAWDTN